MYTRKAFTALIFIFLSSGINAQVYWLNKMDLAKSIAKKSERLIIIDFWASWCGPCKIMDGELWKSPEIQKVSPKFVALKINVDLEKPLTASYKVKSIPKVVIAAANGEKIWEKEGYDDANSFMEVFKAMPDNVGEMYKRYDVLQTNKQDPEANYLLGLEYQKVARKINNDELKESFLRCSSQYFLQAQKLYTDSTRVKEAELNSILNEVYNGKAEKALAEAEKINSSALNENLAEFRHFILAKCYKNTNNTDNYQKEKVLITKKEYLDQLEN